MTGSFSTTIMKRISTTGVECNAATLVLGMRARSPGAEDLERPIRGGAWGAAARRAPKPEGVGNQGGSLEEPPAHGGTSWFPREPPPFASLGCRRFPRAKGATP